MCNIVFVVVFFFSSISSKQVDYHSPSIISSSPTSFMADEKGVESYTIFTIYMNVSVETGVTVYMYHIVCMHGSFNIK